ncbi:unnamed protein product [Cuscuta epithymum]|uniref:CCT domain-containing protein n=1 Tax=Cuscuta epithymum TaxID=186058 RepID=A0AAV0CXW8_9ASTE|nr:unnamed protein product [Cuscuta epithymum]
MSKQSGMSTKKRSRSARKARTRKPKFLSLRLQLSADRKAAEEDPAAVVPEHDSATNSSDASCPQLDLFPLQPDDSSVAYDLFSAAESDATTLTALLGAPSTSASSGEDLRDSSLRFPFGCRGAALARAALRSKERNPCEEKWVCYSEVTSCATAAAADPRMDYRRRLSLKLDYQGIINAWSDKAPLYIQSESPQTVPDLFHDDFLSNGTWGGGWESNNMSLYAVPEMMEGKLRNDREKAREGGGDEAAPVAGQIQRAASVLRYKEKRQNRLFSKTIRYQVRKLNAEKRPRIKGRFVKRD